MIIKVPYRINWAGAYLDCIDEPVITSVIDKYITVDIEDLQKDYMVIYSAEVNESYGVQLTPKIKESKVNSWIDYVDGCVAVFARNDIKLKQGCQLYVYNDLPSGIGVSSSAAFIIAIIKAICIVNKIELDDSVIAGFGYWVEHDYLGIPCGRMDFKAVLHEPGLWKINTGTCDLAQDKLISKENYCGLLIYNDVHNHATDSKFTDNVAKIRGTKFNYTYNKAVAEYISREESIVNCINYLDDKVDKHLLASYLDSSDTNIKRWLDLPDYYLEYDGILGSKVVGSGLRGAHFLLIDPEKEADIRRALSDKYKIESCII